MRQILFSTLGGPEVLVTKTKALRDLAETEVLVRHEAIGVNFIDIYYRKGLYPVNLPSPMGTEAAGVVEAVGSKVSRVRVGDRVAYAGSSLGSYSDAHIVPEALLIKLPASISAPMAASMMLKGLTAAYLLLKTFPLNDKHTILVHAAAGGVGSILTQWASNIGAKVIGTVGSPEKIDIARQQGCDHVLLYRQVDVAPEVSLLTANTGVDVVYDSVGKDTFESSINSLRPRGMMVSFGNASGAVGDFAPLLLAQKGSLFLTRPTLAHYVADPDEQQYLADALFAQIAANTIKVKTNHRFALEDASKAHELLESGVTTGSVILIP